MVGAGVDTLVAGYLVAVTLDQARAARNVYRPDVGQAAGSAEELYDRFAGPSSVDGAARLLRPEMARSVRRPRRPQPSIGVNRQARYRRKQPSNEIRAAIRALGEAPVT